MGTKEVIVGSTNVLFASTLAFTAVVVRVGQMGQLQKGGQFVPKHVFTQLRLIVHKNGVAHIGTLDVDSSIGIGRCQELAFGSRQGRLAQFGEWKVEPSSGDTKRLARHAFVGASDEFGIVSGSSVISSIDSSSSGRSSGGGVDDKNFFAIPRCPLSRVVVVVGGVVLLLLPLPFATCFLLLFLWFYFD